MSQSSDWPELIGGDDQSAFPAKPPKGVTRVAFDFTENSLANFDRMVKEHNCKNRAELIRKALQFLDETSELFNRL